MASQYFITCYYFQNVPFYNVLVFWVIQIRDTCTAPVIFIYEEIQIKLTSYHFEFPL